MKKYFIVALSVITMLCFTGCGKKDKAKPTLATPTNVNVQVDGNKTYIVFDEVDNAEYYTISINGMTVTIEDGEENSIKYNASNIITQPKSYSIKVKAEADNYTSSIYSLEYKYDYKIDLEAPIISKDGNVANWSKVDNADLYEVHFVGDSIEKTFTTTNNSFNVSKLIKNAGKYSVQVRALSNNQGYVSSDYSNYMEFITTSKLDSVNNLVITNIDNELLLSFVSESEIDAIELDVNGKVYSVNNETLQAISVDSEISNMYTIKLSTLIEANGDTVQDNVVAKVKVISNNEYIEHSNYSSEVEYKFKSILNMPTATLNINGSNALINITSVNNNNLMGYNIYIGNIIYKTITKDITSIQIPLTEINGLPIFVQSISNNQNVVNSLLSDALWSVSYTNLQEASITYSNQAINYAVTGAEKYIVEIYNNTFNQTILTTSSSLDLTNIAPGKYNVKVSAITNGKIRCLTSAIIHSVKLNAISDLVIDNLIHIGTITFTPINNAYGYIVYINGVKVDKLFTTNSIDLASYLNEASSYDIQVKAVGKVNQMYITSDFSNKVIFTKTISLSKPNISFVEREDKVFLSIDVDENQADKANKCILWINYVSQELAFEDTEIEITDIISSVGCHTFIIQAVADKQFVKNSSVSTLTYTTTTKLQEVTNINLSQTEDKILLTFDEVEGASKYLVTVKVNNLTNSIETNCGLCDISEFVDSTNCNISIKAIAKLGGWYLDSNIVQKTFA